MEFEKLQDIIDFAIAREKEAVEFYAELSEMEPFSGSKEMFKDFAKEEQKHVDMLINIGEEDLSEYNFEWIPDMKRSNFLVDIKYERGMGYREMLHLAIKKEEKALALYNDMLKQTEQPSYKKVFKMLCQEEAKHKLKLESMYDDYMAEQGD
ncbi:MAG: ferritin family protein [Deltaproteobacteria bacterium]|nr:ferritin family protein [Deltaproteobacteria bacterium]